MLKVPLSGVGFFDKSNRQKQFNLSRNFTPIRIETLYKSTLARSSVQTLLLSLQ